MASEEEDLPAEQPPAAPEHGHNRLGIAGFVAGLLGLILSLIPFTFFVGFFFDVAGIVLGAFGRHHATRDPSVPHRGLSEAGLTMSIIGLVAVATWIVILATT